MFPRQYIPLVEVIRHGLLLVSDVTAIDGRQRMTVRGVIHPLYPEASALARQLHQMSASPQVVHQCLGHLLSEGPKLFEFSARDCEALEHFQLDVPVEEYSQPFPTLMILLPQDYAQARVNRVETFGRVPRFTIIRHDVCLAALFIATWFTGDDAVGHHLSLKRPGLTIEQVLQEFAAAIRPTDPPGSGEFFDLIVSLVRLALSACLMTMVYGTRRMGPDNPGHHARLERHLQAARKSKDPQRIRNAEFDWLATPIRYEFAQEVRLYREVSAHQAEGVSGRSVRPHWRRGHYRLQACGPGLSQRKRIVVPAVLVNSHLFIADR